MSSKNYRSVSRALDRYPTPLKLVRAAFEQLCEVADWLPGTRSVLEPGAGPGTFIHMAKQYCHYLTDEPVGVELEPWEWTHGPFQCVQKDFLEWKPRRRFDFIPANPPFTYAEEFLRHSRNLLEPDGHMFYLARVGLAGTKQRRELWKEINLLEFWLIRPRPSFTEDGQSDSSEYAFLLMDDKHEHCSENVRFRWLDW